MLRIKVDNVSTVINQISAYVKDMTEKKKRFMERLAEIGLEGAAVRFRNAQYDGTNDVAVAASPIWDGDTLKVVASGTTVLFIEFGTGVHYASQSHPKAGEFGFTRGGYGYGLGRLDSWRYRGEAGTDGEVLESGEIKTYGNPANRCMYETAEEMRRAVEQIAKEVFGK